MTVRVWMTLAIFAGLADTVRAAEPAIDFNRQIRPILANKCLACHGPDAAERKAELRLDVRELALAPAESGERAIVPGKPSASELVKRINSADADSRMPPPDSKKSLSDEEKKVLAAWIAAGANYQSHWAFLAPKMPAVPAVKGNSWARGEIDRFILARMEKEGLAPSPEAGRASLVRRLTLDLTGFPPTLDEVEAFLQDHRPDAYERLVDRLVASPRYGERMAVDWLDAARFADTHGYHIDAGRDMTRWREYVIDSFNRNTPYDRFTVEQLAGDLLPETGDPQVDMRQKLASGFNRNHMINFEGGAIPQEYLTAYIIDRVNTTGTVFLGLTVGCTQCHDHKFDPLTQREFYQFYAFFNSVPEKGLDGSKGNAAPLIKVPSQFDRLRLEQIGAEIRRLEERITAAAPELDAAQAQWEPTALTQPADSWTAITPSQVVSKGGAELAVQDDKSVLAKGTNPPTDTYEFVGPVELKSITGIRLEALPHDSFNGKGPGRSVNGNIVLTDIRVSVIPEKSAEPQAIKLKTATADFSQQDYPVAGAIDDKPSTGWAIHPEVGKRHYAIVEFDKPVDMPAGGALKIVLDFQSTFGQHQLGRFRISATNAPRPAEAGDMPANVSAGLALPATERSEAQRQAIRQYYRDRVSPLLRGLNAELASLKLRQSTVDAAIPSTMVMQDQSGVRDTFVLLRGAYDKPGDKVAPGVPAFLPPLAEGLSANRLGLARWLVDSGHPLTARVTVNHYWQLFFGTGIVKTAEDFGTQGELPSHPELLDWLAVDFRGQEPGARSQEESGWNVKRLVRQIVTSSVYRQSSVVTPALAAKDPENRLLARGPRFRLQAEFIRDQALFVSGLYDGRIGGKSVSPYQPPGLWEELMSRADGANWTAQTYVQDHGADLYRRTMYTFWKRTCPPPTLATFDAPDRETCTVRRSRTNTPLQALVLMNDPTYIEAARKFAERILTSGTREQASGGPPEAIGDPTSLTHRRLTFAFRTVLARSPTPAESAALVRLLDRQLAIFRADPDATRKLLATGESPANPALDPAELAAWAIVASAILNTDEAVTKG